MSKLNCEILDQLRPVCLSHSTYDSYTTRTKLSIMYAIHLLLTIYATLALSFSCSLAQNSLFAPSTSPLATSRLLRRHDHCIGAVGEGIEKLEIPSTQRETIITVNSTTPLIDSTSSGSAWSPSLSTSLQSPASTAEHDHRHSRLPAKLEIDENEILKTHAFDPPSYYDLDQTEEGMKGVMVAHVVIMSMAFFVFLPLSELPLPSQSCKKTGYSLLGVCITLFGC